MRTLRKKELPSKIQFVDSKAKKEYEELKNSSEKDMIQWLHDAFKNIQKDASCGIQIPKDRIPKKFLKKYNIHNVWKYDLPKAWRLLYSIESDDLTIIAIILEWKTHKDYERIFKY